MKRIKYYLSSLVISALFISSCTDSFFDINVDPNNPAEATPALVLPSAQAGSAFVLGGYYQAIGAFWTQQYAQAPAASQWLSWESYNLTEDDFNRQFTSLYGGALYDYEYVRNEAAATANWKFYAVATLMQAYTFQVLADLYDQIPFSEALKGVTVSQPHYDSGKDVYEVLLERIDDAMSKDFSLSSVQDPESSDLIFAGDMDEWQKFANTLKLKIYLRYVNQSGGNPYTAEIQALLTENNFLDTDAKFTAFKAEETGYNPYYNTFVDRLAGNIIANKTIVDFLSNNSDPRLAKLFDASATGSMIKGLATGDAKNHSSESIKNYATPAIGETSPVYFFSEAETLFLVSEAEARYGTAGAAQAAFQSAIDASLVSLGLTAGSVTYTYNGLQSIIEQKWVALTNVNGIETFFDYNRTGYPNFFTTSLTSVLNGNDRPKRFFFPSSERNANSNTPAKVALTVPVWWAIQ